MVGTQARHGSRCLDLSYESIKALRDRAPGLFELRLDDSIGGLENIRVIFFVPPTDWVPCAPLPLPALWLIEPMVKKRNDFTIHDLNRFRAGRSLVRERFYSG